MKNSLKQLLRTPVKALLFLLLMAASTALLVFGSVLYGDTSSRIDEVEASFTTLGMVEQVPVQTLINHIKAGKCGQGGGTQWKEVWDEPLPLSVLDFEGADYLIPPESRPYYICDVPALTHTARDWTAYHHIGEVVALADMDEIGATPVQIVKTIYTYDDGFANLYSGVSSVWEPGKVINVCQCMGYSSQIIQPMKKGRHYMLCAYGTTCTLPEHGSDSAAISGVPIDDMREYTPTFAPHGNQYTADGEEIPDTFFLDDGKHIRIDEVTDHFWDKGGLGEKWEYWAHYKEDGVHKYTAAPTNDLQMLPLFQKHKASLSSGREITPEEFESGAPVCMLPDTVLTSAGLQIGDKLSISMLCSLYNAESDEADTYIYQDISPFNAQGDFFDPFWQDEYEIVGTYRVGNLPTALSDGDLMHDMIVIPQKSVKGSDQNNIALYGTMKPAQNTFQIKNGSIAEFDAALHEALTDLEGVEVTYNDNGYEDIMESLRTTWITSVLLFTVGLLAAAAILALLLYFFITKQKKRTAIERSLGMSKRQCRVSLMSGILTLTIIAVVLGSVCATVLLDRFAPISAPAAQTSASEIPNAEEASPDTAEETEAAEVAAPEDGETFSTEFSSWVQPEETDFTLKDASAQLRLFLGGGIPCVLILLVFFLSLLLIRHNLKTEPIYLLSSRTDL